MKGMSICSPQISKHYQIDSFKNRRNALFLTTFLKNSQIKQFKPYFYFTIILLVYTELLPFIFTINTPL
jgi:hypothetical protein